MAIFTGDEIFQLAMELEETGEVFYEAVAAGCGNASVADLCRRLAEQEKQHYRTFEDMRKRLAARPEARPLTWEEMKFAQGLINDRLIPGPEEARRIAAGGSLTETIDLAIRLENDSVEFYTELLPAVEEGDREAVARIIEEERRHARELTAARRDAH